MGISRGGGGEKRVAATGAEAAKAKGGGVSLCQYCGEPTLHGWRQGAEVAKAKGGVGGWEGVGTCFFGQATGGEGKMWGG